MIPSAIRIFSQVVCLVLAVSFGMFVIDELTAASKNQSAVALGKASNVAVTRDLHGREFNPDQTRIRMEIDRVNDRLTGPAEKLVMSSTGSTSPWLQRAVPFMIGLLAFGLLLHMLANWLALPRSGGSAVGPQQPGFTAGYR